MTNIISQLNDSGEWYTPHWIIDLVKEVLGEIDLDPASSIKANEYIGAKTIYTVEDDGLSKPWFGKMFVNAPYTGGTPKWAAKFMLESVMYPEVEEGILLTNANFGYNWYNNVIYHSQITTCVLRELVQFKPADGQPATHAKRATSLAYYGENSVKFRHAFKPYGKFLF